MGMIPLGNNQNISGVDGIIQTLLMQNVANGFLCLGIGYVDMKCSFCGDDIGLISEANFGLL